MKNNRTKLCILLLVLSLAAQGCVMQWGAKIQWSSKTQVLMSESSQVKIRSMQTQVFDTRDKQRIMQGVISTLQDLDFSIDVLDEDLGIISGKKLYQSGSGWADHPTYYRYRTDQLIIFSSNYRTYGPFQYRNDLTRVTVTVRPREETQLLVRASLQHNIQAVEDPEIYQTFFKRLRNSLFLTATIE